MTNVVVEHAILLRVPFVSIPLYLRGLVEVEVRFVGQVDILSKSVEQAVEGVLAGNPLPIAPRAPGPAVSFAPPGAG